MSHDLVDPKTGELFPLRWQFTWSSTKAARDAARRTKALPRTFRDYALVLLCHLNGAEEVQDPKLRAIPAQIWNIMGVAPFPA